MLLQQTTLTLNLQSISHDMQMVSTETQGVEKNNKISRIAHVNPAQGKVYYLCMLLHIVKGAKSFSDIIIVGGHVHPTF
jgi:hypothetical protein